MAEDELRLEPTAYTAEQVARMPAQGLVPQTDGTPATADRVRTAISAKLRRFR